MLAKRIIPCLDIKDGQTVKGKNFLNLREVGNAVDLAVRYSEKGADELVFLDITATEENRGALLTLVKDIASKINIPFVVGGGIRSLDDAKVIIDSGCDKVSINSAAVYNKKLISDLSKEYGSQAVVVAIDAKLVNSEWIVFTHGGKVSTGLKLFEWAKQVADLGAGEILFTSMDNDGIKKGFDINVLKIIADLVFIPVIASGGAGILQHFSDLFLNTKVSAALAASVFHYGEIEILELKQHLNSFDIPIRL